MMALPETKAPWLYDAESSDNEDDEIDGREVTALLVNQPAGKSNGVRNGKTHCCEPIDKMPVQTGMQFVRCAGVVSGGEQCTRTTWLPVLLNDSPDALYCYRHVHQRPVRLAKQTRWCSRYRSRRALKTNRSRTACWQMVIVGIMFVFSIATAVVGIASRSLLLCGASAFGLFAAICGVCVISYRAVVQSLPPADMNKVAEVLAGLQDREAAAATMAECA